MTSQAELFEAPIVLRQALSSEVLSTLSSPLVLLVEKNDYVGALKGRNGVKEARVRASRMHSLSSLSTAGPLSRKTESL